MQSNPAPRGSQLAGDKPGSTSEQLLLVTKFAPPPVRADLVPRPRLMDLLQLGIQGPLTLIAAPAGFGKTTLLSVWLDHAPLPVGWISLEPGDDDPTRFWFYVFTALERFHPGSGTSALALLQGSDLKPPSIETVLTVWINALVTLVHEVVLVLDDYHLITAQPIHRAVTYLIDHLPQQLHLVKATRADPPLALARLRTSGHLTEIRVADLRFTADETTTFLTRVPGLDLSDEHIAALETRTEGWIAGLQLAALSMRERRDIPAFLKAFTGSQRYIIDYLAEEVLAHQPEPVQTFLLQTAILERLQGSLCEAVIGEYSGEASGQAMLEHVEQANLFLVPLDDFRQWYRYHQLFAEALRHRLQRKYPALVSELHRRASAWYEQQGLTHDAVHHALAATDFAQAARLVEQAFNALVRRGEIATLQRWAAALPDELVRSNIELSVLQGWLLFVSGKHDAAEQHLQDIERLFGITPVSDEPGEQQAVANEAFNQAEIRGRIAAIRASIAVTQGDVSRTIQLSQLALEYLPKDNISRAYAAWYLGRAYWLRGDVNAASIALAEASRVSWEVDHLYSVFMVAHDLAHVQKLQGHLHLADQTYRQALQQAQERGKDFPAVGPAYVGRGNLEYEWNRLDAATSLLQEGITFCERTGNGRAILQARISLAFVKQAQGDVDGASAMMQQVVQITEQQRHSQYRNAQVEAFSVWLSLMQGDEAPVLRWLQRCGLSFDQEVSHLREREYLTLVRALIAQRRVDEAAQWLASLLHLAKAQGRTGSVIEILMLRAESLFASGEVKQAVEHLSQVLTLAEPEDYTRLFLDEGKPMAHLLAQVRRHSPSEQSGSTRYRERLLAMPGDVPDEDVSQPPGAVSRSGMSSLVEPLSERELEVLRLIVAGCSNREIADRLVIAVSTVKWYVNAIYGKLQVESRTKAIARARELSLM